ncbi:MAG: hypothetical protein Q8K75_12705 [Chlamydiales bacterium]|nr:hypothetical protein [Chlamydiales bacterium]
MRVPPGGGGSDFSRPLVPRETHRVESPPNRPIRPARPPRLNLPNSVASGKTGKVVPPVVEEIAQYAKGPNKIRRLMHVIVLPKVVKAQKHAKNAERAAVYHCYEARLTRTKKALRVNSLASANLESRTLDSLKDPGIVKAKIGRQIQQRFRARGETPPPGAFKQEVIALHSRFLEAGKLSKSDVRDTLGHLGLDPSDMDKLSDSLTSELLLPDDKHLQKYAKELSQHVINIERELTSDRHGKYGHGNNAALSELRKALDSKAYLHLKEHENIPAIRVLHDLCVAGYLDSPVVGAYEQLYEDAQSLKGASEEPAVATGGATVKFMKSFRDFLHKTGIHRTDMHNPFYLATHTKSAAGNIQCEVPGLGYDPRGQQENNAGAFFNANLTLGDNKVSQRYFFTPSWRLDTGIAAEARAALQSMTNRQYQNVSSDDSAAVQVCYQNAQNILRGTEGMSSKSLMKLNEDYPDAFRGITIPCDTQFHMRGLGRDDHLWNDLYSGSNQPMTMSNFADALREELGRPENFELGKRSPTSSGYFFTCRGEGDKQAWLDAHRNIAQTLSREYQKLESATPFAEIRQKILHNPQSLTKDEKVLWWNLESSMIEEANLMITAFNQGMGIQDLDSRAKACKQATTSPCKEQIDRGKFRMLLLLYANAPSDDLKQDVLKTLMAMAEGRPILSRARMGQDFRHKQGEGCMMMRNPGDLNKSIGAALKMAIPRLNLTRGAEVIRG